MDIKFAWGRDPGRFSCVCVCVCVCVRACVTGSCASTLRSSRVLRRMPSLKSIVSVTTSVAGGDKLLMLAVTSINVVQYRNYNPDAPDMQGEMRMDRCIRPTAHSPAAAVSASASAWSSNTALRARKRSRRATNDYEGKGSSM